MTRIASIAVLVCLGTSPTLAEPLRTAFTCRGQLQDAAAAAEGLHDLRFRWCPPLVRDSHRVLRSRESLIPLPTLLTGERSSLQLLVAARLWAEARSERRRSGFSGRPRREWRIGGRRIRP